MRIQVKKKGKWSFRLGIPTFLLFNRFTAFLFSIGKEKVTYRQAWTLMREVKRYRRKNGKWKLVEIRTSDGEEVEITV